MWEAAEDEERKGRKGRFLPPVQRPVSRKKMRKDLRRPPRKSARLSARDTAKPYRRSWSRHGWPWPALGAWAPTWPLLWRGLAWAICIWWIFDRVDLTNLNRQQYFIRHLGLYKTDALRQELLDINPYLDVRTDSVKVTAENLQELFAEDEIICEAFDVAEQKAMLVNGVLEAFPAKRLVAASGMAGFGDSNRIHTRKVTKNFYLCGDEETESAPGERA